VGFPFAENRGYPADYSCAPGQGYVQRAAQIRRDIVQ
jgi:hypothetical protein